MIKDPFLRYSRQIFIEDIGVNGQRQFTSAKVLVVGAGGLGSPVIQYLAAAGIGTLAVADFDMVELHNLNRQVIHAEKNVGSPKTASANDFVKSFNSTISFIPIQMKLTSENISDTIRPYDIVVDASDNFATRYLVNDTCVQLNKSLVYGSIFAHQGQIAVFNYRGSKNLRDVFPEPPSADDLPDCDSFGVLGALPGIIGSIMAMQTLQIIANLQPIHNQLIIIDTKNWEFVKLNF